MRFLIVFLITNLFAHGIAFSHQQKEAYTNILFNQRTQNIEISHRFYIHDVEHALAELLDVKADLISDKKTQKLFAEHLIKSFQLKNSAGEFFSLELLGYEVEGKFFWFYQEVAIPKELKILQVRMQALQDVLPQQVNRVNLDRKGKKTHSLLFNKGDHWKTLMID